MNSFLKKMVSLDIKRKISIANTRIIEFLVRNETGNIDIYCLSGDTSRVKIILNLLSRNCPNNNIDDYKIKIFTTNENKDEETVECTGIDSDIRIIALDTDDLNTYHRIKRHGNAIIDSSVFDKSVVAENLWEVNGCSSRAYDKLWIMPFYSFKENDFSVLYEKTVDFGKKLVLKS